MRKILFRYWFVPGLAVAVVGMLLATGCGGSGTSAGGGGGAAATAGASSTVILHVSDNATAMLSPAHQGAGVDRIMAAASEFLLRSAWAQTAGVEVFMDGVSQGTTDVNGDIMFAAEPGSHEICIGGPDAQTGECFALEVEPDALVEVSITGLTVDDTTGDIAYDLSVDPATDDVVDPTDPNNPKKTLVCHKGKFTISVGTPAAHNGHMVHGDTLGPCETAAAPDDTTNEPVEQQVVGDSVTVGGKKNGKSNKGNNGNNGNGRGRG